MRRFLPLFFLILGTTGCGEAWNCVEYTAIYDFPVNAPVLTDSLEVDDFYTISYNNQGIWNVVGGKTVADIPPMFGISIRVFEIDTLAPYPIHRAAAKSFVVTELEPYSYLGSSDTIINLAIVKRENNIFRGAIRLKPTRQGLYLLELVASEAYPVYGGEQYKCQQQERMTFRFTVPSDPAAAYFNQLEQANSFKPGLHRLIWVK